MVRFDDTDILSNTHEVEFSLTNRLLAKDSNGNVSEVLSWQLWYKRYLDPTFGGAVIPGQPNVLMSTVDLTGIPFVDRARHQSPVVSVLRYQSNLNLEWRADYDPVQRRNHRQRDQRRPARQASVRFAGRLPVEEQSSAGVLRVPTSCAGR